MGNIAGSPAYEDGTRYAEQENAAFGSAFQFAWDFTAWIPTAVAQYSEQLRPIFTEVLPEVLAWPYSFEGWNPGDSLIPKWMRWHGLASSEVATVLGASFLQSRYATGYLISGMCHYVTYCFAQYFMHPTKSSKAFFKMQALLLALSPMTSVIGGFILRRSFGTMFFPAVVYPVLWLLTSIGMIPAKYLAFKYIPHDDQLILGIVAFVYCLKGGQAAAATLAAALAVKNTNDTTLSKTLSDFISPFIAAGADIHDIIDPFIQGIAGITAGATTYYATGQLADSQVINDWGDVSKAGYKIKYEYEIPLLGELIDILLPTRPRNIEVLSADIRGKMQYKEEVKLNEEKALVQQERKAIKTKQPLTGPPPRPDLAAPPYPFTPPTTDIFYKDQKYQKDIPRASLAQEETLRSLTRRFELLDGTQQSELELLSVEVCEAMLQRESDILKVAAKEGWPQGIANDILHTDYIFRDLEELDNQIFKKLGRVKLPKDLYQYSDLGEELQRVLKYWTNYDSAKPLNERAIDTAVAVTKTFNDQDPPVQALVAAGVPLAIGILLAYSKYRKYSEIMAGISAVVAAGILSVNADFDIRDDVIQPLFIALWYQVVQLTATAVYILRTAAQKSLTALGVTGFVATQILLTQWSNYAMSSPFTYYITSNITPQAAQLDSSKLLPEPQGDRSERISFPIIPIFDDSIVAAENLKVLKAPLGTEFSAVDHTVQQYLNPSFSVNVYSPDHDAGLEDLIPAPWRSLSSVDVDSWYKLCSRGRDDILATIMINKSPYVMYFNKNGVTLKDGKDLKCQAKPAHIPFIWGLLGVMLDLCETRSVTVLNTDFTEPNTQVYANCVFNKPKDNAGNLTGTVYLPLEALAIMWTDVVEAIMLVSYMGDENVVFRLETFNDIRARCNQRVMDWLTRIQDPVTWGIVATCMQILHLCVTAAHILQQRLGYVYHVQRF